jgi:alanine racemase
LQLQEELLSYSNILLVSNSIRALQQIASFHRQQFKIPVIGITGSNGKTIVKEWLGQMLAEIYKIAKSPRSYNSQLGVPLSVLQLTKINTLGIFEAGISRNGEMQNLNQVIRPTLGIFTNIGEAHDEGFVDHNQKAAEKWKLFEVSEVVIYCYDHQKIRNNQPNHQGVFTWGRNPEADIQVLGSNVTGTQSEIILIHNEEELTFYLPFADRVSMENVMHCVALLLYLEIPAEEINENLQRLANIDRRLSLKKGINNCNLIDDSYNNDLSGLQVAIDFMKSHPGKKNSVILSDILQTGMEDTKLYGRVNQILQANGIDQLFGVGEGMVNNRDQFRLSAWFFDSTEQFLKTVNPDDFSNENILIKGARPFEFERITRFLAEKIHGTVLEINLDALINNLNFYRSKIGAQVKLMVMVKASAYGSGSYEIASLLQHHRVDYLAVAYPDEGVALRKRGIHMPVMVMNVSPESYDNILKYDLEPEIYSLNQLRSLVRFLEEERTKVKVHIKLDTGMHRLGFEPSDFGDLISILQSTPLIEVRSIYSHLAGADEDDHNAFSQEQVQKFLEYAHKIEQSIRDSPLKHILNSAGIIRFPEYHLDMVRLGIGLYGFEATQQEQDNLMPISTLKTVISQVRKVKKGDTIGYGRIGNVQRDSTIATIAIGYADGFSRAFSNGKIKLMVNGQLAPVIGNICMDMCMLDVTGIDVKEGDEVIVFGHQPSITDLASAIDTIPYEILTNISDRVTRVFFSN